VCKETLDLDSDEGEEMSKLELVAATALFGWECPSTWKRFSHVAHVVVVDPFFDLLAMSCIVANTVLLAIDHADIDPEMAQALLIGNHVCLSYLICLNQAAVAY